MNGDTPVGPGVTDPEERPARDKDDRRFSVEHRLRSTARPARQEPPTREPWYRGRMGRDLAIVVLAVAIALVIQPFADVANVDYPEARAVADRLDSAWRSIIAGGDAEGTAKGSGLVLHTSDVDGRSLMILTDTEPTSTGICYVIRFGPGVLSEAGVLKESGSGCTPGSSDLFERRGSWSEVLPSERITQPWFIPLMVLLFGAGLYALVDIPIVLVARRESAESRGRAG